MSEEIERVRKLLWEKIRASQADGREVRNEAMAIAHGGERGLSWSWSDSPLCILGVAYEDGPISRRASEALGIKEIDAIQLEIGFEGWTDEELEPNEFTALGKEIAAQLMAEEVARYTDAG